MPVAVLLAIAVAGLGVGPLLALLWPARNGWRAALDALSAVLVAALVFFHLLPHAVEHGLGPAVLGGAIGLAAPLGFHWIGARGERPWRLVTLGLLVVHATFDGAALAFADPDVGLGVALAIAAHRLPVGLVVAKAAADPAVRGRWSSGVVGGGALALLAVATVVGAWGGRPLVAGASDAVVGLLESLVALSLLHVAVFRHRHGAASSAAPEDLPPEPGRDRLARVDRPPPGVEAIAAMG